ATIIATCVTPTGAGLWKTLILLTFGSKNASIMKMTQEVLPVQFSEFFGIWVPAFIIALLALFSMIGGEWKKRGHQFILLAFVFWMMLKNRRFAGFLGLIGLLYLPQWIAFISQEAVSARQKAAQYGMGGLFVVLLILAPFWSYQYYKGNQVMFMTDFLQFREKKTFHPYNGVAFLKQHKPKGKLYNLFDVGGFIHWKLPTRKVFIDGRTNILFKEKFFYTHYAKHRGQKTLPKHLDTLGVSMAILPHRMPMTSLLYNDSNWVPVAYDDKQALFLKRGEGNDALIEKYGYRILRIDTNARRVIALWSQLRRQQPGKFHWLCNEVTRSVRQSTYKSRRLFWLLRVCKKIHSEILPLHPSTTPLTSPRTAPPTTQHTSSPTTQPKKPASSQPTPSSR
ncbi:MAG: hypothetical protein CL920_03715, partial [Deltaproteobacteria bacterium]|nr:hypothetical protein [Deltaproteobacteria bacterium]